VVKAVISTGRSRKNVASIITSFSSLLGCFSRNSSIKLTKTIPLRAVQYFCAQKIDAELIITDNIKDFKLSDIRVISAKDFYKEYIEPRGEED